MTKPKYSDVIEMSDEIFSKKLDEINAKRDFEKHGCDGNLCVWEKSYTYRGIDYSIALIRYYVLGIPLSEIKGMNKYNRWFVLEHPDTNKDIIRIHNKINDTDGEFLYKDTLHSYNDDDTLSEMFHKMVNAAKEDIDYLLGCTEININKHISELEGMKTDFNILVSKLTHNKESDGTIINTLIIDPPIEATSGFTIKETCDSNNNQLNIEISTNERTKKFKCRVCGHDEYEAIYDTSPFDMFGSSIQPVHFMCKGCSVLFKDFNKFSVHGLYEELYNKTLIDIKNSNIMSENRQFD